MTRFVDSEGREYVTSWDAAVSAARDWADGGGVRLPYVASRGGV